MLDNEKEQVKEAIRNIYLIYNKGITKEKIDVMTNELNEFPAKAILAGINSLKNQNIQSMNIFLIKQATKKFIEPDKKGYAECTACGNTGVITLIDEQENEFAFACACSRGFDVKEREKMYRWGGNNIQYYYGKKYTRKYEDIILLNDKEREIYEKLRHGEKVETVCPF